MKSPRAPGAGIARARTSSLGGEQFELIANVGSLCNDRIACRAAALDRVADFELSLGHRLAAERLAWRAAEMRRGGPA